MEEERAMRRKIGAITLLALAVIVIFYLSNKKEEFNDAFLIDPYLYNDWDTLILVNENNQLNEHYEPHDLVEINERVRVNDEHRHYLAKKEVVNHLEKLVHAFHDSSSKHYDIRVTSAYRSYHTQKELYERVPEHKRKGYVATPGCSEHQSGLAIDIAQAGVRSKYLDKTEFYEFLTNHSHEYGFIIRYPEHKQWQTGVKFEPWH